MKIGQAIKQARELRGISQGDFAKRIGTAQAYLSEIETGSRSRSPGISLMTRISKELAIPVAFLHWFALSEQDIKPDRRELFNTHHATITAILKQVIE